MKIATGFLFLLICALLLIGPLDGLLSTANANRQAADQYGIWYDVNEATIRRAGERQIMPLQSRTLAADLTALDNLLSRAPLEFSRAAELATVILPLPLPDGTVAHFRIEDSPIMESKLAAKYPEIKTYLGHGIDDPTATVRFDRTPAGFHAMILSSTGTVYIDPYSKGDIAHYISYYKHDFRKELDEAFKPDIVLPNPNAQSTSAEDREAMNPTVGEQLRTYRLAVSTTGEYTTFAGGTTQQALAAVTTTINRVTGIYEREFSIRLTLVNNNDQIIFTDADSDPFENSNADLNTNQTVVDRRIGSANYDIGHVFVTSNGGVAGLGVVCDASQKAVGLTGTDNPVGDPFDVDYVAHEMGHQFGANHTFNNPCDGNRNTETAYEPGSGSTIMGYAGVCHPSLQNNSDDYFHGASFDQIIANITSGTASSCGTPTGTGNTPPTAEAGASYTIPARTPFMLTGSASDSDNGASLTYGWEQFDLGAEWDGESLPNTDNGNRPIFRSYDPVSSPTRMFPKLETILSGDLSNEGEYLPTTTRSLTFRLTVRDNQAGGGGVSNDQTTLNISSDAGPFAVTAPNSAVTWAGGSQQSVTWDVANTTAAPVNCTSVNILLSTNGGTSFAHTLATSTANDGSQSITVPNDATSSARIKVECAGNIFFDISNANFTISAGGATSTLTPLVAATNTPTSQPVATSTPTSQPSGTNTPTPIPTDPTGICSTSSTTIAPFETTTNELTVTDSGTLSDLNVSLKATHSRIGDLSFTLEHSDTETAISLIDLADCEGANIDATLDDEASSSIETPACNNTPSLSGSLKPNEALSTFDDSALSGTWRLTIENFDEQEGSLTEWCLIATTSGSGATATPSPTPGSGATATPTPTAEGGSLMLYLPITIK